MNILIPHSWLLEHLETDAKPAEIQKFLSLCGPSIERIYEREGEAVYDIEITTNRVDSMSVRGIAREAAVILQQFDKTAKLRKIGKTSKNLVKNGPTKTALIGGRLPLPTIINDEKLCKRIMCVVLSSVERTPTPKWMAKRLRQIDANVHDAVIDITNYVTHELGYPCHAFDYDRIMDLGGFIIVTQAKAGKKFTTLDGVEYTTIGGEVVFENEKGEIIDLPGIKGTANTSINPQTKNVLFWIENIDAAKIRFASMTHAIRTVAAQLNEKNVDPNLAPLVFEKGIELFQNLTHAHVASRKYDDFPGKQKPTVVRVPLTKITEYLGIELPINTMARILEDLGCEVDLVNRRFVVTPPTFRPDLQIPADIIEEIARIYGYHNLPSVVMPTAIPLIKPKDTNFTLENRLKHFLADIGWQEVYTYSMVSAEIAQKSGVLLEEHLKIQNPLTDDRVYMRRSLVPSLVEVIEQNPQRPVLSVFEVANTYAPVEEKLPHEVLHLTFVSNKSYREVKGDAETLLQTHFVKGVTFTTTTTPAKLYTQMATITAQASNKNQIIKVGEIGALPSGYVAVDFIVPALVQVVHSHPSYQPGVKTSEIVEDLTFTLPEKSEVGVVIETIRQTSPLITSVTLKDIYQQNYTFTIMYCDPTHNLDTAEVEPLRKNIVKVLQHQWSAMLIGQLR